MRKGRKRRIVEILKVTVYKRHLVKNSMVEKDILSTLEEPERLIANDYYFKYIFKKTEKIVCAVFYILSELQNKDIKNTLTDELETDALGVLVFVGETLTLQTEGIEDAMRRLVQKLTLLESKLRVLSSARLLPRPHLDVFIAEIDATIRSIRGLRDQRKRQAERRSAVYTGEMPLSAPRTPQTPVAGVARSDRRSRILAVLRAQPAASIKDITDTIKDFSEKTLQRELNDMIKDGIVIREGEKRWSRYSAV